MTAGCSTNNPTFMASSKTDFSMKYLDFLRIYSTHRTLRSHPSFRWDMRQGITEAFSMSSPIYPGLELFDVVSTENKKAVCLIGNEMGCADTWSATRKRKSLWASGSQEAACGGGAWTRGGQQKEEKNTATPDRWEGWFWLSTWLHLESTKP